MVLSESFCHVYCAWRHIGSLVVLLAIGTFRDEHHSAPSLLALAGVFAIVGFAYRAEQGQPNRGMSLVFDVGHGRQTPLRVWCRSLCRARRRERTSLAARGDARAWPQIGATVSHWIGRSPTFQDPGNTFCSLAGRWLCRTLSNAASPPRSLLSKCVLSPDAWNTARVSRATASHAAKHDLRRPVDREVRGRRCRFVCARPPGLGRRCWALRLAWRAAPLPWCLTIAKTLAARLFPTLCAHRCYGHRAIGDPVRAMAGTITADLAPT